MTRPGTAVMVNPAATSHTVDVVVVGGGQAGLAAAYYLRRAGLTPHDRFVVLDAGEAPGGAWPHMWRSLRLFSPPDYSSLPGWRMPGWSGDDGFPPAAHVVDYLSRYEQQYQVPVLRPVRVLEVRAEDDDPNGRLLVDTDHGTWRTRAVVSATGTWGRPFVPAPPGTAGYRGSQLHTTGYREPAPFAGRHVVVVGGGNSGAQVLAEVSEVAGTTWVTRRPPRFLPDDVDGRVLFDVATRRRKALDAGQPDTGGVGGLGDVVMVPPVRAARERGALVAHEPFTRLTRTGVAWGDGREQRADAVIWCTGFRPDVRHLRPLHLPTEDGHVATSGTEAVGDPRVHLLGYGDWTGPASATLIGVGRTARDAAGRLVDLLSGSSAA